MSAEFKFRASDAFVYVDTYRRAILHPITRIEADLGRVIEKGLSSESNLSPTRYYAELRALEHAFKFVGKREEPNLVVLAESDEDTTVITDSEGKITKTAKQLLAELTRSEEHAHTLEIALKQSKTREAELSGELNSREQSIARMKHRLTHTQSTVTVLTFTLAATVIVLIIRLFF